MADYYVKSGLGIAMVARNTNYVVGDKVVIRHNDAQTNYDLMRGYIYECTATTGPTHASAEPPWNTTVGQTTTDGGVTWTTRNPDSWSQAHPFIDYCVNRASPGDRVLVSKSHVEDGTARGASSYRWLPVGNSTVDFQDNPVQVLCVDDAAGNALATMTNTMTGTGGSTLILYGSFYIYGLKIKIGTGQVGSGITFTGQNSRSQDVVVENCELHLGSTATNFQAITVGSYSSVGNGRCKFKDVKVTMSTSGGVVRLGRGDFLWEGGSLVQDTANTFTYCFATNDTSAYEGNIEVRGVDMSTLNTNTPLFKVGNNTQVGRGRLINCKLPSYKLFSGGVNHPSGPRGFAELYNCDTGNANYKTLRSTEAGIIETINTTYKNGGATDGANSLSWRVVTTAIPTLGLPFYSYDIARWNDVVTGNLTVSVDILTDSATAWTNEDLWLEVEFLGDATSTRSTFVRGRKGFLSGATPHDTSVATWSGVELITNQQKQKLSVTIAPRMKGFITAKVHVAKRNLTVYIDHVLQVV